MPFQSVPDTAEIIIAYLQEGQDCTLTFYAKPVLGPYDQAMISELADSMDDWAGTNLRTILPADVTYVETRVRGLTDPVDLMAAASAGSGVGTQGSVCATNSLAFCVSRRSGLAGRSARGRVYLPIPDGQIAANATIVVQGWADAAEARLNEVRTTIIVNGWAEVIVSRQTNGALRPFGETYAVTGYQYVDLSIDTQRRRMPRID